MILMIGTMFLVKCNSGDNSKGKDQLADSTEKLSGDSLNPKAATDTTKNEMAKYVEDYKKQCERKINVDTVFLFKGDSFRLVLTHYCLHDNSVHVPQKYTKIYGLDSFVTHAFKSDLLLKKNNKVIVSKSIQKGDFKKYLDSNLSNYGVVLYPEIRIMNDEIEIGYSVSIPLTDVGKAVKVSIDENGKIIFGGDK